MQLARVIPLIVFFWTAGCVEPPAPFSPQCRLSTNDFATQKAAVPWFDIDLGSPAISRWNNVSSSYKMEIKALSQVIKNLIRAWLGSSFVDRVEKHLGNIDNFMPYDFAEEIKGVSNASGISLSDAVLYNIFYEVFSVCTSIVAKDSNGSIYHGRNMDFGIFLGWDTRSTDWIIAKKLRRLIINVNFKKNGSLLYKAVTFPGYVGTFTAMKQSAFALTINERFILDGGYVGIIEWLLGINKASWLTWMVRDLFEKANDFQSAVHLLSTTPTIAPFYAILSGTKSGEGQIIVRSRNAVDGVVKLGCNNGASEADRWFLLQTNTDPWRMSFFLDDRRTPAEHCMRKLGRQNVSLPSLLQVLSSPTTLNKLTVYSTLIKTDRGLLDTYIQKCPDPCWPW